ncbi:hybrid sensor histidine kinase/response regulator [Nodularia spumigena CS-584]|jgi:two-component system, chemotaxis family, sensor histidine kinase and response regulator PixL|uniref:histidine kinase n=2 Tax=Nodularia spumigena TaxID=70799 RepID=A0A2S0QAB3_NODSP|nr:hybrid sensor histidine kinase/response regulator [Nodularia spumigena]AVZ31308.1 chemosensory pili system protein ChpA (sensor histidine kinase/response regulator) [Nodularia spumigena UHCC 0039]EAW46618.1 CheA Signal Transduction Histidine Kinases (STHK) [Nodularia spumigena CCY9414]MDB9382308.1 hybrid sensor histidine kinase/response regulator [Nodularia spumigena CS-584]MEA5525803.1 hybrid sensor histidine kinase/response regulator [Nodularia spumigena UHCC 0143]MEA5558299.1 hybrid sens
MSKDKELEIQMQFLEEARDYLNTLEAVLLEIDNTNRIDLDRINAALRAAHSIKGGAGMMGFRTLSDLAHRLEDSFKVLKTRKNSRELDTHLPSLLLSGVDWLRQILESLSQGHEIEEQYLSSFCYPVFDELRDRLGEPTPEDAFTMLSPEDGQDIVPMLFETEVEGCLQRLESILADSAHPGLQEEVVIMAAELGGLGEMLQLTAFTSLCESIEHHIGNANSDRLREIAQLALQTWRRSQALILTNQRDSLPTQLDLDTPFNYITSPPQTTTSARAEFLEDTEPTDDFTSVDIPAENPVISPENSPTDEQINLGKDWENSENTVRVPSKKLEEINDLFGELTVQRNGLNSQIEKLRNLVRNLNQRVQTLDRENYELRTAYAKITKTAGGKFLESNNVENLPESDTLEGDGHQKLNVRSQEVMETIVQVQEITSDIQLSIEDTDQITRKLNKTSKQLQTKLTHIRLRPFSDLIERFPRALRDLNIEYGKNVHLQVEGKKILIERSILEALNEPIMHLLRNAFDHGIEDPVTRRQLGKPEQGLIEITATHSSNRTIITMRDDGRGISLEKIRSRAVTMGLDAALVANASEEELLSLIFEPGFTTSDQVTALSGRGVGMDVVRNNLKSVRGDITVNTELGVGTTFTLSVPFTLSVARVLLVESNKMLLAFPTEVVSEIFLLPNEQVFSVADNEVINWQDATIPLIRLGRYFQFNCPRYDNPELETRPAIDASSVLIVKGNNQTVAIQVDRCWGEQEVAIRQVESNIPLPAGFNNCTILGDGRVLALVNTNDLLYWIATNQRPPQHNQLPSVRLKTPFIDFKNNKLPAPPTNHKNTILIIDDSINVRRFLALTLEKGGYQVEQAKDGQDALEKLESGLKVAAIICDIEMPRLDGYGFLGRINSNIEMKHIPVTMLTSRSSNKHRQLAMQLGAQAYFSKPYNEQELLQTIAELIDNVPNTATSN